MPRKRVYDEMAGVGQPPEQKEMSLLQKIRNMWEFANVMQFIFIFGKALKIDEDFDIEVHLLPSLLSLVSLRWNGGVLLMNGMTN